LHIRGKLRPIQEALTNASKITENHHTEKHRPSIKYISFNPLRANHEHVGFQMSSEFAKHEHVSFKKLT